MVFNLVDKGSDMEKKKADDIRWNLEGTTGPTKKDWDKILDFIQKGVIAVFLGTSIFYWFADNPVMSILFVSWACFLKLQKVSRG